MSKRSALLADFGGVLTTSVRDAFRAFSSQISDDPELVLRLLSRDAGSSRLLAGNECGRLDDESFEHGFAARLAAHDGRVSARGLLKRMQSGLSADHQMLDALAALRAGGMPVALVTNSFGRDCNEGFDLHALADVVVISSDADVRKPSRRIAITCERLEVAPASCVMVDDIELARRRAPAAAMGVPEKIVRRHAAGRMTVREGIAAPVDPDSFGQLGASPRRSDLRARDRSRAGQDCPARDPLFWTRVRLQLHGRA
jgi:putative hydrolase of the HAD superfamily